MSVGRSVARARTRVRHPRHRAGAVTGTPSRRWRYRGRGKTRLLLRRRLLGRGLLGRGLLGGLLGRRGLLLGLGALERADRLEEVDDGRHGCSVWVRRVRQRATLACVGSVRGAVMMAVSWRRRVCNSGPFRAHATSCRGPYGSAAATRPSGTLAGPRARSASLHSGRCTDGRCAAVFVPFEAPFARGIQALVCHEAVHKLPHGQDVALGVKTGPQIGFLAVALVPRPRQRAVPVSASSQHPSRVLPWSKRA